jgi:molecular chaperone GrpE
MTHDNEKDINEVSEPIEMKEKIELEDDVVFEEVNDEGEVSAKDTIKKLREKIKLLEKESKDHLDGWTRAKADYANFAKEVELRRKDDLMRGSKNIIRELLPVLDAYDMARSNDEAWQKVDQNWRVGIEYIFSQFISILDKEGVKQIGAVGEVFDPTKHESVELVAVEDESSDGKIIQVLQKGYTMSDVVLRPARVKTGEFKK